MTRMLTCRRCHAEPTSDGAREVGEWIFCEPCFQLLLASRAEPGAEALPDEHEPAAASPSDDVNDLNESNESSRAHPATEANHAATESGPEPRSSFLSALSSSSSSASDSSPTQLECMLCDQSFEPGEGLSGRLLTLCPGCVGGLLAPYEAEPYDESPPQDDKPAPIRGFVDCIGCDRRIPRGGAREHDDGPVCPECHAKRSAEAEAKAAAAAEAKALSTSPTGTASVEADQAGAAITSTDGRCAACEAPGPLSPVAGFSLCEPCRSVEPELALEVARARHRKRLLALRDRLASSPDESA